MNRNQYRPQTPRTAAAAFAAALFATVLTTGSVLALLHAATTTPRLPAEQAALVAHCGAERTTAQRRACVQAVASGSVTRVAAR